MKEHKYSNEEYTQYSASYIGYGDGKVYVEYNGRIEAFDETTLEPVWISEELSHEETNSETGKTTTVDDTIASRLFYDDGHLYFGTGKNSGSGKYYVIDTKSEKKEDATKTEEIKNVKEIISSEGSFYLKNAVKVGQYIITSDNQGTISSIDTKIMIK